LSFTAFVTSLRLVVYIFRISHCSLKCGKSNAYANKRIYDQYTSVQLLQKFKLLPNHLKVGNIKEHSGDSTMLENAYIIWKICIYGKQWYFWMHLINIYPYINIYYYAICNTNVLIIYHYVNIIARYEYGHIMRMQI